MRTCKAESMGYTCNRTTPPLHCLHYDLNNESWWILQPEDMAQMSGEAQMTGYMLVVDPMLPAIEIEQWDNH